jgi:hypothetical protein
VTSPSQAPNASGTGSPVTDPSQAPNVSGTGLPVTSPSQAPNVSGTGSPVISPSQAPNVSGTGSPVISPIQIPVVVPTRKPHILKTVTPSFFGQTIEPTYEATTESPSHASNNSITDSSMLPTSKTTSKPQSNIGKSNASKANSKMSSATMAGIIVAAILVLILLVVIIYFILKQSKPDSSVVKEIENWMSSSKDLVFINFDNKQKHDKEWVEEGEIGHSQYYDEGGHKSIQLIEAVSGENPKHFSLHKEYTV